MSLEIEQQLVNFVQATSAMDVLIEAETDLLMTNVLDSLLLMELVIVVESNWGIKLQGDDIAPKNFRCIRNLASLVHSRQESKLAERTAA